MLQTLLAAYVIHLQDEQEGAETLNLGISKGDLSKVLGTTQKSLSRVFKRMNDAGIIALDKRRLIVLEDGQPEDLAEGNTSLRSDWAL